MNMRKWTRMLLLAGLLALMLCGSALAAEGASGICDLDMTPGGSNYAAVVQTAGGAAVSNPTTVDGKQVYPDGEKIQLTVSGADASKQYMVFVLKGETAANPVPTEDNIYYIDQQSGSSVVFNIYPKSLESGATYGIYTSDTDHQITKVGSFGYYASYKLGHVVSGPNEPITVFDARAALQMSAGIGTWTETQILAANVDGEGDVDVFDARNILRASAGLSANFDY